MPVTAATDADSPKSSHRLRFSLIAERFAICRLDPSVPVPEWALRPGKLSSITRTSDELSIVCPDRNVPAEVKSEGDWACLRLEGPFPFSMTGVLASFIGPLSANKVPVFSVSTFDTDYVLIKEEFSRLAQSILQAEGHQLTATSG
jgi:uncharacterized protein